MMFITETQIIKKMVFMNVLLRSQEVLDSCDEFYIGDILF